MYGSRFCWRSGPVKAGGAMRVPLAGLLDVAARSAPLGVVLADAEFDSEANHEHDSATLGSEEHYPRETPGCSERCHSQSDSFRAFSEKTVSATQQDRKRVLRRQTQALLARTLDAA